MKLVLLWWFMVVVHDTNAMDLQPWRRVTVESSWFTSTVQQMNLTLDTIKCAMRCAPLAWCEAWCHDGALGCQLTNLVVSGSYQTNATTNVRVCYTNHSSLPEYAFRAAITSSLFLSYKPTFNVIDGIYNWDINTCACSSPDTYPWVLLDLGRPVNVNDVLIIAQPSSNVKYYFTNIEVRVGVTQAAGNFSSYALLGTFPGPGQISQRVIFKSPQTIVGQYLSIQMKASNTFQFCHLEIH